jgi:glycosyltransferase involved in cell wall biosynthesis
MTRALMLIKASGIGGTVKLVARLACQLPACGFDVRLVVPDAWGSREIVPWLRRQGVNAEASSAVTSAPLPGLRTMIRLARLVRLSEAKVVNIHTEGSSLAPLELLAVRAAGCKCCIVSPHKAYRARNPGYELGKRVASRFCSAIVVGNQVLRDLLIDARIPERKIHLIPIGVPAPLRPPARAQARQHLGIALDAFVIGCVARLHKDKGVDVLIDAVARVPDPRRAICLIVAGDGEERAALEAAANDLLPGRVRFLGFVEDLAAVYSAADIFALASRREGTPLVLKEAAQYALPSVATDVGGTRDAITDGETGFLVPPDNPAALAASILRLMNDDPFRLRLGNNARLRADAEFGEGPMIRAYADVLDSAGPNAARPLHGG